MPYLVCDKCGGFYELQEGENPHDFTNECDCGGRLILSEEHVLSPKIKSNNHVDNAKSRKNYLQSFFEYNFQLRIEIKLLTKFWAFYALIELLSGLYILFFVEDQLIFAFIFLIIGIILTFIALLSTRAAVKKIYWIHSAACGLLFLQSWFILDISNQSKIWTIVFLILALLFARKETICE